MRQLQIAFFGIGVLSFLASAVFAGTQNGDTFWRAGVAFMLGDIALVLLWPRAEGKRGS
jgi:hypothetical protein